jgi:hypothetical protein
MLFYINASLPAENRVTAYNAFSNMTPKEDAADSGPHVEVIGRWHALNMAEVHLICETENVEAMYNWMLNWTPLVNMKLVPVVNDTIARKCIQSKNYFKAGESATTA